LLITTFPKFFIKAMNRAFYGSPKNIVVFNALSTSKAPILGKDDDKEELWQWLFIWGSSKDLGV
jgi:hypothetical protein